MDLEGDLVLSVRDTGPQVLFGEVSARVWKTTDDRLSCSLYRTGNTVGPKPADVGQPSDPPCADQQQAFGFAQALQHARPGPALRARERATAASTEAPGPSDMGPIHANPPLALYQPSPAAWKVRSTAGKVQNRRAVATLGLGMARSGSRVCGLGCH